MNYAEESLRLHAEWQGKIEVVSRVPVKKCVSNARAQASVCHA